MKGLFNGLLDWVIRPGEELFLHSLVPYPKAERLNGLTDSVVQVVITKVAQYAGIEDVTPHTLRHTFGKSLIDQGVDLVTVTTSMGHKRLDSMAHYTKPSVSDLEGAVARLATEEA
jgi:site-specific recombinase XerD